MGGRVGARRRAVGDSPRLLPPSVQTRNNIGERGATAVAEALKEVKPQGLQLLYLVKHLSRVGGG